MSLIVNWSCILDDNKAALAAVLMASFSRLNPSRGKKWISYELAQVRSRLGLTDSRLQHNGNGDVLAITWKKPVIGEPRG